MSFFGLRAVRHPGCRVGARVRNTVPGDFHVDKGTVVKVSGTHDVSVLWDDEATMDPSGRTWWELDVNVEHIEGT